MEHDPLFGSWLKRRRKALGLTQRRLGECAGCSAATVRKIEAEERRPSVPVARKMAVCLGLAGDEIDDFLRFARGGWADDAPAPPPLPPELPRAAESPLPPALPAFLDGDDREEVRGDPFVARVEALSWLEGHLEASLGGRGGVVFVIGEAGNGKTSLLNEFSRRAQSAHRELIVARGVCSAFAGSGDPYLPFRDLMTMLCGDVEARWAAGGIGGDHARRLWRIAPHTAAALGERGGDLVGIVVPRASVRLAAAAAGMPDVQIGGSAAERGDLPQPQLFEQLTSVLRALAAQRPLLLLLDDLQWADRGSVGALFHLVRRLPGSAVLIVGAFRSDEIPLSGSEAGGGLHPLAEVVQESRRQGGEVVLSLDRRGPIGGRAFVDALLDSEPNRLDDSFRAELTARTEGHPLFTVELLRDLQARGDLTTDASGRWQQGVTLDWSAMPARVEAVIEQRLGRLEPELRELLTVASVEGEIFTAEVLARILGRDELEVLRFLDRDLAARHRLIGEEGEVRSGGRSLGRYRFGHALFQQYLYGEIGRARRRRLHSEIAEALERVFDGDEITPQIASHLLQAGEPARAAPFLERAGDRARRLFALEEAIRLYREAAEAFAGEETHAAETLSRARCLRKFGECSWILGLGNYQQALAAYGQAFELFSAAGEILEAATVERLTGRLYWELSDRTTSMRHYRRALALAEQAPDSPELAMVISSLSQMHMLSDDFAEALHEGERALALAERLDLPEVRLHALNNIGLARGYLGEFERGEALLRESLDLASERGLPHDACRAMYNLGELLLCYGQPDASYALNEEILAYAERTRIDLFRPSAIVRLAEIDWRHGRWRRARARLHDLLSEESDSLLGYHILTSTLLEARMATDLDRPDEALTALVRIESLLRQTDESQVWVPYFGEKIRAHDALGQQREAGATVDALIAHLGARSGSDRGGRYFPELATALCWLLSDPAARSSERQAQLSELLEHDVATLDTPEARAFLAETRALAAGAAGDLEAAAGALRSLQEFWREIERPLDEMRVALRLAAVRAAAGDSEAARQLRSEVASRRAEIGAEIGADAATG